MLAQKRDLGYAALNVMEQHLAHDPFFVGGRYSIADIALYAYTHVADEGGFDLRRFPAIQAWLERVKTQPKHISITQG
jgi:glutathione S-transferase